jgi:hypothetical protein
MLKDKNIWIIFGWIILTSVSFTGAILLGLWISPDSRIYFEEPNGHYTMRVNPDWALVETEGEYVQINVEYPPATIYMYVCENESMEEALPFVLKELGLRTDLFVQQNPSKIRDWDTFLVETEEDISVGLACQEASSNSYVFITISNMPGASFPRAGTTTALRSVRILD